MPLHSSKLVQLIQPKVAALLELTGDSPDSSPPSLLSAPHEYLAETLTRQATVLSFEREPHLISSQQERERERSSKLLSDFLPVRLPPCCHRMTGRQTDKSTSTVRSESELRSVEQFQQYNCARIWGHRVNGLVEYINANNRRLSIPLDSPYFRVSVH